MYNVLSAVNVCFRDEIAACIEKAYEKIAFGEAARMLFFESEKPMRTYAQEVRSGLSSSPCDAGLNEVIGCGR